MRGAFPRAPQQLWQIVLTKKGKAFDRAGQPVRYKIINSILASSGEMERFFLFLRNLRLF
jgi:hypothetical protein